MTLEELKQGGKMEWLLSPSILYALSILGMLSHFLKKKIKGESFTEIGKYFHDNPKSTILAFIATSVGFLIYINTLATGLTVDFFFVYGIGYTCDSLFNKYEPA